MQTLFLFGYFHCSHALCTYAACSKISIALTTHTWSVPLHMLSRFRIEAVNQHWAVLPCSPFHVLVTSWKQRDRFFGVSVWMALVSDDAVVFWWIVLGHRHTVPYLSSDDSSEHFISISAEVLCSTHPISLRVHCPCIWAIHLWLILRLIWRWLIINITITQTSFDTMDHVSFA